VRGTNATGTRVELVALLVAMASVLIGCASAPATIKLNPGLKDDRQTERLHGALQDGATQTGLASWYGPKFDGRRTANGEVFDMNGVSAAHKTLPFGTVIRVKNLENGRSLNVRINDRGPFIKGRIIDLSRGAAQQIGMLGSGVAHVEIAVVAWPQDTKPSNPTEFPTTHGPWVQAGAFRQIDRARALAASLQKQEPRFAVYSEQDWHRVQARLATPNEAQRLIRRLKKHGVKAVAVRPPK